MENELPEGWIETSLTEVFDVRDGTHDSPKYTESGYQLVTSKNIKNGQIDVNDINYISEKDFLEINKRSKVDKGDLLFSMIGTIGNSAIVAAEPVFAIKNVALFKPKSQVLANFLAYYLNSPLVKDKMLKEAKGTTQKFVGLGYLREFPFPLPPLAEQTRIVAKLDAAFAHLGTLKTSLARIPELLKKFRQTVLTQAVTGKLTEADIKRWEETTLADIIESKPKNGYSANPVSYETPFKVLTLSSTTLGKFSPNHYKYFDEPISKDSHFWLQPNDILIQRGNTIDYVGVSAIYDNLPNEFIYPDLMIKVRANQSIILTQYLYFVLSCSKSRNYLRERATGTTGNMPKINQPTLISLPIQLPPLEEQQEIVRCVEALFAKADALEAQYVSLKEKIDKLPQALLAKAFRGELVPQDPTDEPASVLLEKIKAAANTAGKKKTRQTSLAFMEE
ncbi:restriction endonuclease subunit S [Spirosoma sp. SC4-14]|uniref:restriction endonuclease subunit S n=1 Tax=Spirosoma sp. SC4-14 TaxID=3128900 RepID=UPI0030CC4915